MGSPIIDPQFLDFKYIELLSQENSAGKKTFTLEELGFLVNHLDQYLHSSNLTEKSFVIATKLVEQLVIHGSVSTFDNVEERDFDEKDFCGVAESAVICFSYLKKLLHTVVNLDNTRKHLFLCNALILCSVHHKKFLWSDELSVAACTSFINELKLVMGYSSVSNILCDDTFNTSVFQGVLLKLKPLLTLNTWQKNPSSCNMFVWFLTNVQHPYLADYLPDVLPPTLMFIDHYKPESKVLGICCLDHIISNVPPSLLKMNGRADVIYDALSPLTYLDDFDVVNLLHPCLIKLLSVEKKGIGSTSLQMWSRYDDVYHQLLQNVEMHGSVKLQKAYLCHITLYLEELSPIKHLKNTLQVLKKTLEVYDGPEEECRIHSLKILQILIKKCWPRMEVHCEEILTMVMILMYDTVTDRGTHDAKIKNDIIHLGSECLILLHTACPEKFMILVGDLIKEDSEVPAVDILKTVVLKIQKQKS